MIKSLSPHQKTLNLKSFFHYKKYQKIHFFVPKNTFENGSFCKQDFEAVLYSFKKLNIRNEREME